MHAVSHLPSELTKAWEIILGWPSEQIPEEPRVPPKNLLDIVKRVFYKSLVRDRPVGLYGIPKVEVV